MKNNKNLKNKLTIIKLWLKLIHLFIKENFFNEKVRMGVLFYVIFFIMVWGVSTFYLSNNNIIKKRQNKAVNTTPKKVLSKEEVTIPIVVENNAVNQINKLIHDFKNKNNVTNLNHAKFTDSLTLLELKELNMRISMIYLTDVLHKMNNIPDNVIQFLDVEKINAALMEQIKFGIPTSITLAQAASESSWGNSKLAIQYNNYFGIKCKKGDNSCVTMATEEHYTLKQYNSVKLKRKVDLKSTKWVNGKKIYICKIYDEFRIYPSFWYSFRDHSNFLSNNDRYAKLFQKSSTYEDWCEKFKPEVQGGVPYATSIYKSNTLRSIIKKYELFILDF